MFWACFTFTCKMIVSATLEFAFLKWFPTVSTLHCVAGLSLACCALPPVPRFSLQGCKADFRRFGFVGNNILVWWTFSPSILMLTLLLWWSQLCYILSHIHNTVNNYCHHFWFLPTLSDHFVKLVRHMSVTHCLFCVLNQCNHNAWQ